MDQVFHWAGRAAPRNPSDQPCRPSKTPSIPPLLLGLTQSGGLLSLMKLKEVFCCGVSSLYSDCINIPCFFYTMFGKDGMFCQTCTLGAPCNTCGSVVLCHWVKFFSRPLIGRHVPMVGNGACSHKI